MTITVAVGATTVTLPPDLYWSDETEWNPVEQAVERTITGALIVSAATRTAGRPITLQPENENAAWIARSVIDQLKNWAAVPGQQMTLTVRSVGRTVIFRHHDGVAIDATPIIQYSDVQPEDWYVATLRFMEI